MKVNIKKINHPLELKNTGMEFGISNSEDKHLGDVVVQKAGLIWCEGKTTPEHGIRISWNEFIKWANEH